MRVDPIILILRVTILYIIHYGILMSFSFLHRMYADNDMRAGARASVYGARVPVPVSA